MAGVDGVGLCTYAQLRGYLAEKGEERLLSYVHEENGRYHLIKHKYAQMRTPSLRYPLACVFMLLGEYTIAEEIHQLRWSDLSSWGDKVGNDLLKHFMKGYTPRL